MRERRDLLVALTSLSLITLELSWTRIFSAEFFYSFAFLILSVAVLGLGLGALAVRLSRAAGDERALPWWLLATAVAATAGPPLAFAVNADFGRIFQSWALAGNVALTALLLGSAYFCGGAALAQLFARGHADLSRLYTADLAGAGLGVLLCVVVMNVLGTPTAVLACGLPVLLGAALTLPRRAKPLAVVVLAAMAVMGSQAASLLSKPRQERAPVSYTHWDAVAKLKVYDYGEEAKGLEIDNAANSPVHRFDGDFTPPPREDGPVFGIDVRPLIERFDHCTFLSLGAGGGGDVLQALVYGAAEVHAVEVVPHINRLLTDGPLAEFTGRIYQDPRVTVATEDGRSYVRRHRGEFDLIYSLSSNTFAALASGSFAMAENYLFTREAFRDYWLALSDDGFLSMEHQFYMPRLVSEALLALQDLGVADPAAHLAVYDLPEMRRNVLLLSKQPLTEEIRRTAYWPLTPERHGQIHLLYPADEADRDNLIQRIVDGGWEAAAAEAPIDISPCDDNRPFTAQLGLWKNFRPAALEKISPYEFRGFPLAKLLVAVVLAASLLLVAPLTLLPRLGRGPRLRAAPWFYFFLLGMAFMTVEVVLIQQYALLIGPSVYGLVTVLTVLLAGSGLGSRLSPRAGDALPFLGIAAWLLLDVLLFPRVAELCGGWGLGARAAVAAALIAPLGLCMGMPFPKGGRRVGALIDWGFAVNGIASVVGSALAVLVAFVAGYRAALLMGGALYLAAGGLLAWRRGWAMREAAGAGSVALDLGTVQADGSELTEINRPLRPD